MINYGQRTDFLGGVVIWLFMSVTYAVTMMVNMLVSTIIGAGSGWVISCLPFIGRWVTDGFNGIGVTVGELYKIGAAAGFIIGATKGQFVVKR